MKGKCYTKCPWYTSESGSSCVDSSYNAVTRPYVVLEDLINKDFSHSDL